MGFCRHYNRQLGRLGYVRHSGDTGIDTPYDFLYEKTEHVYAGLRQKKKKEVTEHGSFDIYLTLGVMVWDTNRSSYSCLLWHYRCSLQYYHWYMYIDKNE